MKLIKMRILMISILLCSCSKYQVVQEVRVNLYHMHHPSKGVEIILTKDKLQIGNWYRLNKIETIDIDN